MPRKATITQPRICQHCGGPYRSYDRRRKYCSVPCRGLATRGEGSVRWKGGTTISKDGYLMVYEGAEKKHYRPAHRLIMAAHLGRELTAAEIVHHQDGDKLNNRLENLVILPNPTHSKLASRYYRDDNSKECAACRTIKLRSAFHQVRSKRRTADWDPHFLECKVCWNARKRRDRARKCSS